MQTTQIPPSSSVIRMHLKAEMSVKCPTDEKSCLTVTYFDFDLTISTHCNMEGLILVLMIMASSFHGTNFYTMLELRQWMVQNQVRNFHWNIGFVVVLCNNYFFE